ncbi:(2Fe-2S)-binding protein [Pseudobacteriovorax antillogorgiicola]|uniref:Bacterioferritin-associated ferredoxin n=1 Tax=Pseudobacteriovorax antillogorgiicola TaxID=1513793 RepID=A0A1Y6CJ01_9BACT|nr:(2Fe-2S)-binding protein [Pseudobacteriovorax antillogorgiicola]TCS46338.1 bacterioferritin-associated ferredoxin [Pseudobacteriovorax antillogorgiicola]SMF68001.1 bacterioferritin-associated ferredoxin [Pseudobacteriovorax antillogorgiicola]
MYICLCHGVTDSKIRSLLEAGASIKDIQKNCHAGTDCGACINSIQKLKKSKNPLDNGCPEC